MIKINIKENKGITLVTFALAIIVMAIISSVLLYNAQTGVQTRSLNNMYNDIRILKDKVDIYYSKYAALPIIKTQYTNVDKFKDINPNDNDNYYVIDLATLDNLTLTYGKDYELYKTSENISKEDVYVINEQSHTIYYTEGIQFEGKMYYTIPGEYTKIEASIKCNHPKLGSGMIPVKWNEKEFINTAEYDSQWYDYIDTSIEGQTSQSKWANARTADGSMWVWIPRYAYKITYKNVTDKSLGGTIDVVFLKDNTDLDFNGNDVTSSSYVDENGKTGAYIVHPAFRDGRGNGFENGEWDSEITGFWMAKFEAGYAGTAGDAMSAQDSTVKLSVIKQYNGTATANLYINYYGERKIGDLIKYPVFQANRPSMNNLGISDAFDLSKSLTQSGNPYGINNLDSHLTKNSEWGAVAYLAHSKYGRNGNEITINNISVENENTIYAITGYAGADEDNAKNTKVTTTLATIKAGKQEGSWTTEQGQTASSTGNVYGIYDLSGGAWEWTAGYVTTTGNYETYGGSLKGESNKYKSKYAGTSATEMENYKANITRVGEAIWETSTADTEFSSWKGDTSRFCYTKEPFLIRGGGWTSTTKAGVFAVSPRNGTAYYYNGFRPVLVVE